jgi:uncharacterized Tic20 family protein
MYYLSTGQWRVFTGLPLSSLLLVTGNFIGPGIIQWLWKSKNNKQKAADCRFFYLFNIDFRYLEVLILKPPPG